MSDFELFGWKRQKVDDVLARQIRTSVHIHHRDRGRGGHRFRYATLKNLWAVENIHAVLNHKDDPAWQYWYNHPKQGWILVDWRMTRREAQALAELPLAVQVVIEPTALHPGWHVYAGFGLPYTMDVACSSEANADDIAEVYAELGCEVSKSLVSVPLPEAELF